MKELYKKIINSRVNIILIVFTIFLIDIHIENTVLGWTDNVFSIISKLIRYGCYLLFLINIFLDWKCGEKLTWSMVVTGAISVLTCIFSKNTGIVLLLIVLFALRKIEMKRLIKIAYYTNLIMFIIVILSSIIGIIPNWIFERDDTHIRLALGYHWATIPLTLFFFIVLMSFYLKREKVTMIEIYLNLVTSVVLFKLTDSRTGFILILLVILSTVLIKILNKFKIDIKKYANNKVINYIICILPMIILILVFLIIAFDNNPLTIKIDDLLSGRIGLAKQAIQTYEITPFGEKIEWYGWGGYGYIEQENFSYNFVDISYIKILLDYGVVFLILLIILYSLSIDECLEKKDYYSVYILLIILLWACIEPNIINISMNIFVLLFIPILNYFPINNLEYDNIIKIIRKQNKLKK